MAKYSALLYGIYPRTETLRKNINLWERKKVARDDLVKRLAEEKTRIIGMLKERNLLFTDPLSNWHDILRPLALSLEGVSLGELRRYRETNTFYRQPVIEDYPSYSEHGRGDGEEFPYFPVYDQSVGNGTLAFVPGPHSFLSMSHSDPSLDRRKVIASLSRAFSDFLSENGARRVLIYDPVHYNGTDMSHLLPITEKFESILVTSGSIRGVDMTPLSRSLGGLSAANGYESFSGFGGEIYMQHINSQNTKLEDARDIVQRLDRDGRNLKMNVAGVTHTEYMDFLPRSIADRKAEIMGEVVSYE